jgi:ParB-like chromosome segregation protein Spo0J
MKKLNILNIRTDGGTQPRLELDQAMVKDYAEKMRDGIKFPPIIVFHDGSEYWLADGFHRYFATKSNAITTIEAEVKQGTLRDAMLFAWSANNRHGKPPKPEDIRAIIRKMFEDEEWGKWSNVQIAKQLEVSISTVQRLRVAYQEEHKEQKKTTVTYVDKHGNTTTMETSSIKKKTKKTDRPTTKPDLTTEPSEVEQKVKELADTVNTLAEENTLLRDKIALGQWDASEIEKIDAEETIKDLRNQIKVLEIENKSLRESRDIYQNENAELIRTVKSLKAKLKKFE